MAWLRGMHDFQQLIKAASDRDALFASMMLLFLSEDGPERIEKNRLIQHRIQELSDKKIPNAFLSYLRSDIDQLISVLKEGNLIFYDSSSGTLAPTREAFVIWSVENTGAVEVSQSAKDSTEWEPLPLDLDNDLAEQAIDATEKLLERVRGENGFAATQPKQYQAITWSIQAGIDALRRRTPTLDQIRSLLIQPTKWLGVHFSKAAIGELAKQATAAILRAVGLSS
jgi:hypothetical protein